MSIKSRLKKFWGNKERDIRLTPKPELDLYFGIAPGIQYPEISPSLPLIKYVHDNSPTIKIATMRLRESIFRRGFEWEPNFIAKCLDCEKEYDYEIDTCDNCGGIVVKPTESEITIGKNFFKNCNIKSDFDGRTILTVLKQIEDDINVYDDAYLIGIKEYWQDEEGNIIWESLHELVRGDPIMMRIVANEYAEMGHKWATCLRHRDQILEIPLDKKAHDLRCLICNRYMYDIHYVNTHGEAPEAYYIGDEVIHVSKYAPSQLYGFSPIVTLWQNTLTLTNMSEYIYRSYTEQHLPKGVLAIKTSNPDSAFEFWRDVDDKLRKDPHYIPKMFIEGEGQGSGSGMEFVKFMDTLEEMQYTPIRDEIRRTIAAMYGVTNIFMGDMGGVGGLNAESEQIQITNMAAESAMVIYNENIMSKLMGWLHIQDWQYKLNSPFEEDNSIELNEDIMKSQIAQSMLMMGFNVELDTTSKGLEFKYSGKAQKPEMGGFGNEMMMGLDKELPHCPQGYHRVDGVCKPKTLAEQLPGGLHEQVHAKYPSRFEADKPLHEQVGTKFPSRPKKKIKKSEVSEESEFLKELNEIFEIEINKILEGTEKFSASEMRKFVDKVVWEATNNMRLKSHQHIANLYTEGQEYVSRMTKKVISFSVVDKKAIEAITKSKVLWKAYARMDDSLSEKINNIITESYAKPEEFSISGMVKKIKEEAFAENYRLERIVRTESHVASMTGREIGFRKVDPEGTFKYIWRVRNDKRTSKVCKAIQKRIPPEGVSLDKLKAILKEESMRYGGKKWEYRDFVPHINCRSRLVRVV